MKGITKGPGSPNTPGITKPQSLLGRLSLGIVTGLESFFYRYGCAIARYPAAFIMLCVVITVVFSIGLMKFTLEERPFKLWIPQDSDFIKVMEWQKRNFPTKFRLQTVIYEADNVLNKTVLLEMLRVHEAVVNAKTEKATWSSVCAKMPTIKNSFFGRRKRNVNQEKLRMSEASSTLHMSGLSSEVSQGAMKRKRSVDEVKDWSTILSRDTYCSALEDMSQECIEHSILEIWEYDYEYINSLEPEDIIDDINNINTSPVFGFPTNFTDYLGKVERNSEGQIVRAGASRQLWVTSINLTAINDGDYVDDTGTGMEVDTASFEWEKELIKAVLNETKRPNGISLYLMAASSFGMISGDTIIGDAQYLAVGFGVVFIYIQVMLGKFNMVEQRPVLSLMGLTCVGMSIFVSYGICSVIGEPFGPVNNVLPFLLLGLGIDDMFVIMQAWNNLKHEEKKLQLTQRIGCALKHAGVSITVTSLTDFAAFAIGSSTVLPALKSFCIYAAVGIAAVYFFQATFFVAWFALDQRRIEDHRHGFFWCWKIKNWTPNQCSQKDLCQTFFGEVYAKILFKLPVKICILGLTAALLSVSAWGLSTLRQEFNPIWFLPQSSYLFKFFMKQEQYYPTVGERGTIYFGDMINIEELPKIDDLMENMENNSYISEVDSWYLKYKQYWKKQNVDVLEPNQTEEKFLDHLGKFLHSPSGSRYRVSNFVFNDTISCTEPAPYILASSIEYKHLPLSSSWEKITAMDQLKEMILSQNFSGFVSSYARVYSGWETDKIIEMELYRNMGLAMLVVFLVTLLLIANLAASLMVLLCVLLTLIEVGALMAWWGLTIDTVSCIDIVLAIGLCVDYAAHVAHAFMIQPGTRDQRARNAVANIGPAVLNGGFSTFLAFVFLANSDSHVFSTFFKIFFGVVLFGLYHGLVFLPVLLSMVGPQPYPTSMPDHHNPTEEEEMCPKPVEESDDHHDNSTQIVQNGEPEKSAMLTVGKEEV
ncbi:hypothetical protein Pmani_025047 [Petrolisthes manimaculis]|uniref:SSD domain-containing protein n=1 Tax=Petrolisthes manimaculis TaxID=1843537 RepID=A0AAE1P8T3_9EUCA|nr:hypothetical protein Pmani_025047 [Petrolisthes manimaculis]